MSAIIKMRGGRRYFIRTLYQEPLKIGMNRVTLRFFRLRWYDRLAGLLAALYVVAQALRGDSE